MNDKLETAKLILEHLKHRPIQEHIEWLEAEIMMMEARQVRPYPS